jgi:transcriptional repressor NrdR
VRCPFCHHTDDRVVDSRSVREGRAVRRRRECLRCERRFTTYEYIEERPLQVLKRDGEREPYDRRKLLNSIQIATAKRPVSRSVIDRIVEEIERELDRRESGEAESQEIGGMVMDRLKARDHIAYVRFASVYRNFQDPEEFYQEFRDLADRQAAREMRKQHYELPLEPGTDDDSPLPETADQTE